MYKIQLKHIIFFQSNWTCKISFLDFWGFSKQYLSEYFVTTEGLPQGLFSHTYEEVDDLPFYH